jgi:hypothetical protein
MNVTFLHLGDYVKTIKGCRFKGPFCGTVVGFSTWGEYDAAQIKKTNGRIVQCLLKNLRIIRRARNRRTTAAAQNAV